MLNLHSIALCVFDYNERAQKISERIGFREVGRFREWHVVAGERHDKIWMQLLAREFAHPALDRIRDGA